MSIDERFERCVCINLDRRPDRWRRMRGRFARLETDRVERAPAWDGGRDGAPAAWRGREGAYGCLVSHRSVVAAARADGVGSLLVLEDDVEFAPDVGARLDAALAELPDDWGFLHLGASHRRPPTSTGGSTARCVYAFSTYAYAVRASAYPWILDLDVERPEPIDVQLAESQGGRPCYCMTPNAAWVECDRSDVMGELTHHWYLRESLVVGEVCDADMAGRVALAIPVEDQAWRGVAPEALTFIVEHFRSLIPGLLVEFDGGDRPADTAETRARRTLEEVDARVDCVIVAGAPVLFTRSHILATLQMCRRFPVVSPMSAVVALGRADGLRAIRGRRRELDYSTLRKSPRDGLDLGWGFFRRGFPEGPYDLRRPDVYRVPGFGLLLSPTLEPAGST